MPNSRKEFERNMHLFSEKMKRKEVRIGNSNIRTLKGLSNAKYSPNRRVNLHTVDEMARLMANSIVNMMNHGKSSFEI